MDLKEYIDFMTKEHNQFSWEIGWESLSKYIGHKIHNRNTKEIAIVNWDPGYPRLLDESGNEIICCRCDFRGGNEFWEYKVGEEYL